MYNAEVLSKFPVVQHFPFGSLFSWEQDPNAAPVSNSVHTASQPPSLLASSGSASTVRPLPPEGMRAPWASQHPIESIDPAAAPWAQAPPGVSSAALGGMLPSRALSTSCISTATRKSPIQAVSAAAMSQSYSQSGPLEDPGNSVRNRSNLSGKSV